MLNSGMMSTSLNIPEREPSSLSGKLKVTLLSSEWWSSKGGISTLNRVLAKQLAKHPLVEVTVFVLRCSEEEKREAFSHNINVVKAARQPGLVENVWLCFPPNHLKIDIVIGHGAVLGAQAKIIRENRQCKWVQVVHTAPKELGMFKTYSDPILKGETKHQVEVELCEMADFVVGVGPKLCEAFRSYLRWCKNDPDDVINLTPGIFDDYTKVEQAPQDGAKCHVLTFGRGDEEDFTLKGFDIAAKAVAELSDTILIFAGTRDEDLEQVTRRFLDCGISREDLLVTGFIQNKHDLSKLFCQADLALMPSRTEGFGLTALEALSAGLPILVSHNSGFGEALSNIPFGSSCVIESKDASVWSEAIRRVWEKSRKKRLQESDFLRTAYGKEYSWENQCNELVNKMLNITHGMK